MLEVWFTELHALFRLGCSRELRHRSRSKGQLMSLQAWDRLMLQCKLYNKNFGQLQGTLVFTRSVMRVDNDIKERVRATCLAFPDFVEALCRVRWPRASVRTCVAAVEQRPPPLRSCSHPPVACARAPDGTHVEHANRGPNGVRGRHQRVRVL